MPRKAQSDPKADALANLVGGGEEANDKDQAEADPTVEDTETTSDSEPETEGAEPDEVENEDAEQEPDPKADALQALVKGSSQPEKATPPVPSRKVNATGKTVKIGIGKSKAIVAADVYAGRDNTGNPVSARKGDTVILSTEKVDRGVRLGLLVKP